MTEHNLPDKDDAPWLDCMDGFKMAQLTKQQIDALVARLKAPEDARRFLQDAGLIDENGELAKPYSQVQ